MLHDRAYVLHKKPYKDSSELIKILSQQHGVIDLLGKGSRNPKSKFKGQLHPFMACDISFTGRSSLKTLVHVEQSGSPFKSPYINQVAMLYCNELLLLSNYHDEANQSTYASYAQTIEALKQAPSVGLILREFEWQLCCAMGYELSLPPGALPEDGITFDPVNGLEVNVSQACCPAQVFERFLQQKAMSSTQLKQLNVLMRLVVNHLVHGKTIQSRALLKARPKRQ